MLALLSSASLAALVTNGPNPRIAISGASNERARTHAEEKTSKATARFASLLNSVDVHLKTERRGGAERKGGEEIGGYTVHVAEAVCRLRRDKRVVRVTSESESMHEGLDLLSERLGRQLRKCKERKVGATRHAVGLGASAETIDDTEEVGQSHVGDPPQPLPVAAVDAEELLSELRSEYLGELDDEMLTQLRTEDDDDELDPTRMNHFGEAAEDLDVGNSAHHFRVFHEDDDEL